MIPVRSPVTVPPAALEALSHVRLKYTDIRCVFESVRIADDHWVGVAGDGDNAAYEWWVFQRGRLVCSDKGYGDTAVALRDVLVQEVK